MKKMTPEELEHHFKIENARDYSVVKDNALIQKLTRRKYELTTVEQKIIGYILSLIKPPVDETDEPVYRYEFDIKTFCDVVGIQRDNGGNYRYIKEALGNLADHGFWVDVRDPRSGKNDTLYFQWINTPVIHRDQGSVEIYISPVIMPYLWKLSERFTEYKLYWILGLKSAYSIALYEFLKSYAFQKSVTVEIEQLRYYLGLKGTKGKEKYPDFKDFKKRVLNVAKTEINEFTDLDVDWEGIKTGRSYSHIRFSISKKKIRDENEAYRKTLAKIHGRTYIPGQTNIEELW